MTSDGETILKTDVLGRVKVPKERREQLLEEFDQSGFAWQKSVALMEMKYMCIPRLKRPMFWSKLSLHENFDCCPGF